MKRILIVGGVAGGASAAARARRLSEEAEIVMFERGEFVSFANCGLPYHIGATSRAGMPCCCRPQSFKRRFNVDVRVFHDVIEIDKAGKSLLVRNLLTGEERREAYDVLLLSRARPPSGLRSPVSTARVCTLCAIFPTWIAFWRHWCTISRAMSPWWGRFHRAGDDGGAAPAPAGGHPAGALRSGDGTGG